MPSHRSFQIFPPLRYGDLAFTSPFPLGCLALLLFNLFLDVEEVTDHIRSQSGPISEWEQKAAKGAKKRKRIDLQFDMIPCVSLPVC